VTYPHIATVSRQTKTGTKYTFAQSHDIRCFLQPLSNEESVSYGITMTKAYHCYMDLSADAIEGDRLLINGDTYGIKGFRVHDYGSLKHKRAILEKS
jgi:hypothetical protein